MDLNKFYFHEGEQPLENIPSDGGFAGIFRTIGCIGDSLSSGEFESKTSDGTVGYHDMYEYSWGQYLARLIGSKVYNFSKGGMTAREYCQSFAESRNFWDPEKWCQAYIIALGVNDLIGEHMPIGSVDDVKEDWRDNNKETLAGWYGQIIQRYREIEPKSRMFLVTMLRNEDVPQQDQLIDNHTALLYQLAEKFEFTYVIDLAKYGPVINKKYTDSFYMGGHLNPAGYLLTSRLIAAYMDYIIRKNPDDFSQIGFIHYPVHNVDYKW